MNKIRDEIFKGLFDRMPTDKERVRFDKINNVIRISPDDPMWYIIMINEFYDSRTENHLNRIDNISDNVAKIALGKIVEIAADKIDEAAIVKAKAIASKESNVLWQVKSFFISLLVVFGTLCAFAGYVIRGGEYLYWPDMPPNLSFIERTIGFFLNMPAGWILFLGTTPFQFSNLRDTWAQAQVEDEFKGKFQRYAEMSIYLTALIFSLGIIFLFF